MDFDYVRMIQLLEHCDLLLYAQQIEWTHLVKFVDLYGSFCLCTLIKALPYLAVRRLRYSLSVAVELAELLVLSLYDPLDLDADLVLAVVMHGCHDVWDHFYCIITTTTCTHIIT